MAQLTDTNRKVGSLSKRVDRLEGGAPPAQQTLSEADKTELEKAQKYAREMKVVMSAMGSVCAILAKGCTFDATTGEHMAESAKMVLNGLNTQMEVVFNWTPEQRRIVYESMRFGSFVDKLSELDQSLEARQG